MRDPDQLPPTLDEILDAQRLHELAARETAQLPFEGMNIVYNPEDALGWEKDYGWYYGPIGEEEAIGPFATLPEARADITDRPLREEMQHSGRHSFAYQDGGDPGWQYWLADVREAVVSGDFATFAEALADCRAGMIDAGLDPDAPTSLPPDQPAPGEADKFPPVLATLINEFDWRHHPEHLQKITRPFAAIAFLLARTDPHPFWTEKAMLALVYARYLAMKAWAYTEDPGE